MTLSRTARILVAVLLLAAAAFFWVNFFTQGRLLADDGGSDPSAGAPPTTPPPAPAPAEAETPAATPLEGEAEAESPTAASLASDAGAETPTAVEEVAPAATEADASVAPVSVPLVVVEAPVTLSRAVVVADLPFLVTSPPQVVVEADEPADEAPEAERRIATARASVNPFSPVVIRQAAAPEREVPAAPVVIDVAVPAAPAAPGTTATAPRVATPTPQIVAPSSVAVRDLPRALPSGSLLSATPDLIRVPTAPNERVDLLQVPTLRVPEPDSAAPMEAVPSPTVTTAIERNEPEVLAATPRTPAATSTTGARIPQTPLAAGAHPLDRFLRDNGYTFTGSALGPVSVGVFRSTKSATPVVVALGQTLPESEIVLTDLRGQQAELTLGDTSRILVLDLRR
jgi:hypothetical protein